MASWLVERGVVERKSREPVFSKTVRYFSAYDASVELGKTDRIVAVAQRTPLAFVRRAQ